MRTVTVRVLRPLFLDGRVIPPGETIRLPADEAEARRLQGLVETMTNERREMAVIRTVRR